MGDLKEKRRQRSTIKKWPNLADNETKEGYQLFLGKRVYVRKARMWKYVKLAVLRTGVSFALKRPYNLSLTAFFIQRDTTKFAINTTSNKKCLLFLDDNNL